MRLRRWHDTHQQLKEEALEAEGHRDRTKLQGKGLVALGRGRQHRGGTAILAAQKIQEISLFFFEGLFIFESESIESLKDQQCFEQQ